MDICSSKTYTYTESHCITPLIEDINAQTIELEWQTVVEVPSHQTKWANNDRKLWQNNDRLWCKIWWINRDRIRADVTVLRLVEILSVPSSTNRKIPHQQLVSCATPNECNSKRNVTAATRGSFQWQHDSISLVSCYRISDCVFFILCTS